MSYKVYPVIKTDEVCSDYIVKINGKTAELNTARVSAVPFNRRWPGHQRSIEQTELINFVSLQTDEKLDFEIIPRKPFNNVDIRPKSLGIKPSVEDSVIKFTLDKPSYITVEPYGRNCALHIFADPISYYNIDRNAENVIYFGEGVHEAGIIELKSNQTVFIDEGAVLYATVQATDAENISIIGRGILDNSRNKEKILYEANAENNDFAVENAKRLHTVQLNYCKNIRIDGITIRDSLVYNIRPIACTNIDISNVKIIGCWRYNADGIDMHNCINVAIRDCFLRTYDDSICVKGFDPYGEDEGMERNGHIYNTFKNVAVERCTIWNDWGKSLEIGAETQAEEICGIVFSDCDIIHVTGCALDCENVDYADVHDVVFKNIRVEYDEVIPAPDIQKNDSEKYVNRYPDFAPALISVGVSYHPEYSASKTRRGKNRRFIFKDIFLSGRHLPEIRVAGYDEISNCSDITVENLRWNGEKTLVGSTANLHTNEFCKNIIII